MRVGILSFEQNTNEKIYRFTSGTIAAACCKAGTHTRVSKKVIRELIPDVTPSTPTEKHFVPKFNIGQVAPSELNPPTVPTTLVLSYPLADQSSYAKRDFKLLWGCTLEEWRKKIGSHVST
jgi:hypothetical protein